MAIVDVLADGPEQLGPAPLSIVRKQFYTSQGDRMHAALTPVHELYTHSTQSQHTSAEDCLFPCYVCCQKKK